jgi:hypothetical protein
MRFTAVLAIAALPILAQNRLLEFVDRPTDQKILLFINHAYISRPYMARQIQKNCPEVEITQKREHAQFRIDDDFGENRWIANEIALYDKSGDLITTASAKNPKNAIKNLCAAITTVAKN